MSISSLTALTSLAAPPVITVQVPAPVVTVQAPAPAVTVAAVPDTYVWDGYEFVGVVGTQYYYLGPGKVWLALDAAHAARFHEWEKVHADWRKHAVRNTLYRLDAHGHSFPLHDRGPDRQP